jgi:hypothetical protein
MKGRREAALGFSDVCAKLRVTRLRHDRRYLSNTVCSLNVLPRNESAYDVDARRIDNDAPIACRHQRRPGWKAPFA